MGFRCHTSSTGARASSRAKVLVWKVGLRGRTRSNGSHILYEFSVVSWLVVLMKQTMLELTQTHTKETSIGCHSETARKTLRRPTLQKLNH